MVHVTCDLCGKELRVQEDQRYIVKIEVYAATDPFEITEEDLDEDHMEAVSELIQDDEEEALLEPQEELARQTRRYDLCPTCRKKFLKDPLNREANLHFDFSEN
jgi:hypothetical protein